jgi:hypothetical protein
MSGKDKPPRALDEDKGGSKDKAWWQPALVLFFRLSAWIAAPALIGALIGGWLDNKYNGGNSFYVFFIVGFFFIFSMLGLVREAALEFKKIAGGEAEKKEPVKEEKK